VVKGVFFAPVRETVQEAVSKLVAKNIRTQPVLDVLSSVRDIFNEVSETLDLGGVTFDPDVLSPLAAKKRKLDFIKNDVMFVARDGKAVPVCRESLISVSEAFKELLEIDPHLVRIETPQATAEMLERVKLFVEHEFSNPSPAITARLDLTEWANHFFNVPQTLLFELIVFSSQYRIQKLVDASCRAVADLIKGKTPEQIRKTFNIRNDFTPEEEEAIRKENEWVD